MIKRLMRWLGGVERVQVVNLGVDELGARMKWPDVVKALEGRSADPAVRAVVQMLVLQLGLARQAEMLAQLPEGVRDYNAGMANGVDEVLIWVLQLVRGEPGAEALTGVREYFSGRKTEDMN